MAKIVSQVLVTEYDEYSGTVTVIATDTETGRTASYTEEYWAGKYKSTAQDYATKQALNSL